MEASHRSDGFWSGPGASSTFTIENEILSQKPLEVCPTGITTSQSGLYGENSLSTFGQNTMSSPRGEDTTVERKTCRGYLKDDQSPFQCKVTWLRRERRGEMKERCPECRRKHKIQRLKTARQVKKRDGAKVTCPGYDSLDSGSVKCEAGNTWSDLRQQRCGDCALQHENAQRARKRRTAAREKEELMTGNSQMWVVPESLFLSENRKLTDRNSDVSTPLLTNSFVTSVAKVSSDGASRRPTSYSRSIIPAERSNEDSAAPEAAIPGMAESGVMEANGLHTGLGGISSDLQRKWVEQGATPEGQCFSTSQSRHVSHHDKPYSYSANPYADPLHSSQAELPQFFPPARYNSQNLPPMASNAYRHQPTLGVFGSMSLSNIPPNGPAPDVRNSFQPYDPQMQPYGYVPQHHFDGMLVAQAENGYSGRGAEFDPFLRNRNSIWRQGGQYGQPQGGINMSGAISRQTRNPVQFEMNVRSSIFHPNIQQDGRHSFS